MRILFSLSRWLNVRHFFSICLHVVVQASHSASQPAIQPDCMITPVFVFVCRILFRTFFFHSCFTFNSLGIFSQFSVGWLVDLFDFVGFNRVLLFHRYVFGLSWLVTASFVTLENVVFCLKVSCNNAALTWPIRWFNSNCIMHI